MRNCLRRYRPAAYWRERLEQIAAQIAAVAGRVDVGDRAAAGGCALGPKRTARQQGRSDAALQRYTALEKRRLHAETMLRRAQLR